MITLASDRLKWEHKQWRKNHPLGFVAKPTENQNGSLNYFKWNCSIPGKVGSPWAGGLYHLELNFNNDYPNSPPVCVFRPPIFHLNVSATGIVSIPTLDKERDWRPGNIESILDTVQNMLHTPIRESPINMEAYDLYRNDLSNYIIKIREQARRMIRRG